MQGETSAQGSDTPSLSIAMEERKCPRANPAKATAEKLNFWYGTNQALKNINLVIPEHQVTALIGPSGCGKSTFLRCFNRMHDLQADTKYEAAITLHPDNVNLVGPETDPIEVRMRIGMVFQKPNPFPKSVFENVAYGLRLRGINNKTELAERVEKALRGAAIWDEVKDRLNDSALALSGGQMQRVCISRARDRARDPAVRRADLGARPDRDRQDRGTDHRAAPARHGADRHAQHAAGGARLRLHGLHVPRRAGRGRRDLEDLHQPPKKATEDYITGRYG
jgi:ABC-type ATPase involved in cell division